MSKGESANSNNIEQGKNTNQSIIIIVPKKRTSLKELFVREKKNWSASRKRGNFYRTREGVKALTQKSRKENSGLTNSGKGDEECYYVGRIGMEGLGWGWNALQ